jgi:hypothetical protein
LRAALCIAAAAACVTVAEAKPRAERITERRIMRLEAMERRMEAAAQLPPRPADVRRAIRSGAPGTAAGPNAMPPAVAAAQPRAATQPRAVTPPQQSKPVPAPAAEPAQAVTPATAVDDGMRSVLIRGEPTPAAGPIEPIELLPQPPK